jgi:hypothetical protein
MKRLSFLLSMAITVLFCVAGHGQTIPTGQPQRVQHPYYQYDGFIEAKGGILLPRRIANFTPKSPAIIFDTVSGRFAVYTGGWKSFQDVAYTADYNDLINRPDLSQYVPTSRTVNGYPLTSNVTINKVDIGLGNVQNVDVTNGGNITAGTIADARLSANVTLQGNTFNGANQLLQLDAAGKVAYANLPAALMIYKGVWDASTNTPTLTDGSGVNGWLYRVSVPGTVDFGSGSISFNAGDYVIYNGSIWQKSGGGDAVVSVNGQQGVVVLSTANISEGGTNYYYTDARVQTFGDTRYSLLNHEHVYSDIANLGSYTGFDVRYKSISYVPAWSDITGKPSFATVATSGSYSDLSGTPTLGSLAALSSIGNAYITDVAWSKITGAPTFLTTETDPTIYAWAKASVKPSYTYAEIGGTVPTWNQNTTGNAATATLATNSTQWAGFNYVGSVSTVQNYMMAYNGSGWGYATSSAIQTFLGLGSNAYTSTPFLPLTGGTLSGSLSANGLISASGYNVTLQQGDIFFNNNLGYGILSGDAGRRLAVTNAGISIPDFYTNSNWGSNQITASIVNASNYFNATRSTSGVAFLANGVTTGYLYGQIANTSGSLLYGVNGSSGGEISTGAGAYSSSIATSTATALNFGINQVVKYTIDASGNNNWVGAGTFGSYINLNTSSPAWGGSFGNNALNLLAGSIASVNGTDFRLFTNLYYDGGSYRLRNTGYGSFTTYDGGEIAYYTSGYSTAGSVATMTNVFLVSRLGAVTATSFSGAGTGLTGNASSLSIGGNAATASNSSQWNGQSYSGSLASTATYLLVYDNPNGQFRPSTASNVQTFLGLGSAAYQNTTAFEVPLTFSTGLNRSGNTITNTGVTSIAGTTNQIAVSAATGSVTVSLTNDVVLSGTITSSASYETSDSRLKKLLPGTMLMGKIEALEARLYEKQGRQEYGYFAQDALNIIPTAVKQRTDGYYDLSYTQVFVVKIASLEKRVLELETLLQKIYGK